MSKSGLHELVVRLNTGKALLSKDFYLNYSLISLRVLELLREMGVILNFRISGNKINVFLKYYQGGRCVFEQIRLISRVGKRQYWSLIQLEREVTKKAQGFFILSTSVGLLVDSACLLYSIGGEVLLYVDL